MHRATSASLLSFQLVSLSWKPPKFDRLRRVEDRFARVVSKALVVKCLSYAPHSLFALHKSVALHEDVNVLDH